MVMIVTKKRKNNLLLRETFRIKMISRLKDSKTFRMELKRKEETKDATSMPKRMMVKQINNVTEEMLIMTAYLMTMLIWVELLKEI